jgi:hypothetical protein
MGKRELVAEHNPKALFADGFDEAIIGYVVCQLDDGNSLALAYYDSEKCVEILMEDMIEDEALDYFHYNVTGAYMGIHTPVFRPFEWDDDEDMEGRVLSADGGFRPDEIHLFEEEN